MSDTIVVQTMRKDRNLAQLLIRMPSSQDVYGTVEDMFGVFMHIAQSYITTRRGRYLCR